MRLDDANVADEYGPDRFMPREVDGDFDPPECAACGRTDGLTFAGGRPFCQRHARGDR